MWSLAVLLTAGAVQLSTGQEEALRLRLGALPALWKLQTDVEALQGYLENPAKAFLQISGPDCECIGKTQGPDCECIGAKPTKASLVSKKGPDCECIGKTQGPDCECIGAKPTAALAKKGPDCECIGKTQGPDCECIGKAPAVLVSKPNSTVKSAPVEKAENATPAVDTETAELLKKANSVDVKDMPMMLTILEAMYSRFKENIKNANELEAKTKKHYEENMAKYRARKAANKDDTALDRMEQYWEKSRKLSHAHYHSMLKVAHAGMARLQMAIDMMTKAVNGQKLDKKELEHLKAVTPAPTVVLLQVRTDLLKFCEDALIEIKSAKTMTATSESKAPIGFLQIRQDPAPEDALAKEMTHDLEMNFNKIAPFGKEDTAKELQDHAADTQDTLVDAVENAEVAEIKRAVFRALTRLRAATIKEFDTIARLETQAIDAYNDAHHYRAENPLSHLHEDEAPVETDKLKSFH